MIKKPIIVLMAILNVFVGCSSLSDLPQTADAAFALPDVPRRGNTLMETFTIKATLDEARKAAEYALASNSFDERPASRTDDRQCGKHTISLNEWAMWGCFYFQPIQDGMLRGRVIVESWNSLGATTDQLWQLHLVNAFQNRLRLMQSQ